MRASRDFSSEFSEYRVSGSRILWVKAKGFMCHKEGFRVTKTRVLCVRIQLSDTQNLEGTEKIPFGESSMSKQAVFSLCSKSTRLKSRLFFLESSSDLNFLCAF